MARSATRSHRRAQPHAGSGGQHDRRDEQAGGFRIRPGALVGLTLAGAATTLVGGLAPWARQNGLSYNGANGEGWILIGAAGFSLIALLFHFSSGGRIAPAACLVAGGAALGVAIYDLLRVRDAVGASVGWGLYVALAGSVLLLVAAAAAAAWPLPRRVQAGRPEDMLFFSRIRRQAKWVFFLLAIVFAGTFVFLGVGSGSSGISDLLQGNLGFLNGSSGNPSVAKARLKTERNPRGAAAWHEYALALQAAGQADAALPALERYTQLRPKDVDGLQELAAAYTSKLRDEQTATQALQAAAQTSQTPASIAIGSSLPLGQALSSDKATEALREGASTRVNEAYAKMQATGRALVATYRRVAAAQPKDPSWLLALIEASRQTNDVQTMIDAARRFLALAPDDPTAPQVRQLLKQGRAYLNAQGGTSRSASG